MTRTQRRIFARGALVGTLLTIIVIAADIAGALSVPEDWLYDLRARHFQFFTPKPSDQLVHVDIDDRALETIGAWPWPRAKLAAILDEMQRAGVKAVALDVLFVEQQPLVAEVQTLADGFQQVSPPIDNDAAFADSLRRMGNVVVASSLSLDRPLASPIWRAMVEALRENPSLEESALVQRLGKDQEAEIANRFLAARRVGMFERIDQEMRLPASPAALRKRILPGQSEDVSSAVTRTFSEQLARWESIAAIKAHGAPAVKLPVPPVHTTAQGVPIPAIAQAAAASAFVDFTTDRDGVLRSVPLIAELDGRLVPHLGLGLALQTLGVEMSKVAFDPHAIRIPVAGGQEVRIPTQQMFLREQGREVGMVFDLPWFGGRDWQPMYDWPEHRRTRQHIPIGTVWEICEIRGSIAKNNANVAVALRELQEAQGLNPSTTRPSTRPEEDPDSYAQQIDQALFDGSIFFEPIEALPAAQRNEEERILFQRVAVLKTVRKENQDLAARLQQQREALTGSLSGKSVLIGYTATGMLDVTRTSLHSQSPGVVAHGLVFSSIMSGDFWRRGPFWMTLLATLVVGLIVTATAGWLSPLLGLGTTLLVGAGYLTFNGVVLFDRGNLIIGLAGPLSAAALVWAGCTLNRIIIEANERARITRRFGYYVDPSLVSKVVENPDRVRFDGEKKELTVVFTDLEGFTKLSEKLGEQTVSILNEYMQRMVPIISAHRGTLNKFLGDGIMFFFGAPIDDDAHAIHAVETVLEMYRELPRFNEFLESQQLPRVGMRAGISSGPMVVGDAGSIDRSDYTVLGDTVNLGARLESANKATGTQVMMNARTAGLLEGKYLLRPIGKLQVVGKEEGVMTYEVICPISAATPEQKQCAQATQDMINAFSAADFARCIEYLDQLDARDGACGLTEMYREECEEFLKNPPAPGFDGRIKLSEK